MCDALDGIAALQGCDKIVSSLVFHQCPMEIKQAIAAQMHRLLRPGGQLFIADYGEQRSPLRRMLFRQIQWLDGVEYTDPTARGCMQDTLAAAGLAAVEEAKDTATPPGSFVLHVAARSHSPPTAATRHRKKHAKEQR